MRLILLVLLSSLLLSCSKPEMVSELTVQYPSPKLLKPFELADQNGNMVTNEHLMGQWNLLFLGYTSCPDICPMTLAKLTQIKDKINTLEKTQVWFVSVDPSRDSAQKRKDYIAYFDDSFLAVTHSHKHLFPFVRDIGLIYAINDSKDTDYYVDHSASIALIDPTGRLSAIFKPEFKKGQVPSVNTSQIVADFEIIIRARSAAF
ncbi:SCO family protein [Pseudoalteromonas luteoviolacea]|uniref:Thioredoxin domain-containing protein n=1 Tax=Pseudoalteromonas luteoviolacea S4054 TaxID=1129367 RepID=A0A0F6AC86_9GAMM|nr:SCO family protein [Pseudoalteromonas luteoviolacea]AOT06719.1 photosynthetic protein synthase I [Pseudoalteromonas luteoviolacea]AOT11637.1 photosynthetic protein synthase I [Pseudoalteromonas luteoviolacea]AOT16549.1 photosynthetic protein synthase I [Pseudoalteromonas luteoviolacea]KKE83807.1 hypothetical protein N479_12505 [Pseudoalteromonas luteoviolacea S4054]KZN73910.1 hypothetical protein N481_10750 [Pseudoalteromonas luteoviolacea S4047-1]